MCVWFEIPVVDMDRARSFYGSVFGWEIPVQDVGNVTMGFFPMDETWDNSGALVHHPDHKTSRDGVRVYLNGGEDLAETLARVEPAGGKVIVNKTHISDEIGYFAIFADTEGNAVALHSPK